MTTSDLINYYIALLIIQFQNKPKAMATVGMNTQGIVLPQVSTQSITFVGIPTSGAWVLSYNTWPTSSLSYIESSASLQTALQSLPGLSSVTVSGGISAGFIITFIGVVTPIASLLVVTTNTLVTSGSVPVSITIAETDQTLPLAVQQAFNFQPGTTTAVGVQLDILGKYLNASRTANTATYGYVTLDDVDYLQLLYFACAVNNLNSDLYSINNVMNLFFPGTVLVFDDYEMTLTYFISSSIGSQEMLECALAQGFIPQPNGVTLIIIFVPVVENFFGFILYDFTPAPNKPFNTYVDFNETWNFLSYADQIPA